MRLKTGEIDCALVDEPFAEPFCEQSTDLAMQHPFNLVFARPTPLAALDTLHAHATGVAPAGFVFDMSRCGFTRSTFVEYAALQDTVFSELLPFSAVRAGEVDAPRMRDAAHLDSKDARAEFRARTADADPPDEIERLAAAWLDAPYAPLRAAASR